MDKKHVSASQLGMMEKCGEQWYRRYVKGEKKAPGIAASIGSAVHKTAEKILKHKCDNEGEIISAEETKDTARDAVVKATEEKGLALTPDEWKTGKKVVMDKAKDQIVLLADVYRRDLAPMINPKSAAHVEKEFRIDIEGFDYDLYGFIDVVEENGFRDLKTAGKKPNIEDINSSDQYTFYALWHFAMTEETPEIYQDTVIKTKKPTVLILSTKRDEEDFEILERKLGNFSNIIEKGVFPHASPMSWWCSEKWCGYYNTCKYTRNPKTVALVTKK